MSRKTSRLLQRILKNPLPKNITYKEFTTLIDQLGLERFRNGHNTIVKDPNNQQSFFSFHTPHGDNAYIMGYTLKDFRKLWTNRV